MIVRPRVFEPRDLWWQYPIEVVAKIDGLAAALGVDLDRKRARPADPYAAHTRIVAGLFREGRLYPALFADLAASDRDAAAYFLRDAKRKAQKLMRERPSMLVAFPPDEKGYWSNLLAASWIDLAEKLDPERLQFVPLDNPH